MATKLLSIGTLSRPIRQSRLYSVRSPLLRNHAKRPQSILGRLVLAGGGGGIVLATAKTMLDHRDQPTDSANSPKPDPDPDPHLYADTHPYPYRGAQSLLFVKKCLGGLWEIVITVLRSGELLVRFIPLLVACPVVWFGQSGTLWWYRFLRSQMSGAGPTFVKLSQWAASRTDLFSAQLCLELGKLHDSNSTHPSSYSKRVVAEAFGVDSLDSVFEVWNDIPMGAGAVAQVHAARFLPEFIDRHRCCLDESNDHGFGQDADLLLKSPDVAIKVLHPGVEKSIRRDLRIMRWGAHLLSTLPGMKWLSLPEEVAIFGEMMESQVDLRVEGCNTQRFTANFKARPGISFPHPYMSLSSSKVLVESFCSGIPLKAFLDIDRHTPFDRMLGSTGLDAFLHMLIYDNFVHADLHPGNIMVELNPPYVATPLDRFVEDFYDMSPFNKHRRQNDGPLPSSADAHEYVRRILKDYGEGRIGCCEKNQMIGQYMDYLYASGFTSSIVFLDCGLVTSLDNDNRHNFIDLFESVCTFDGQRAGHLMIDRCLTPEQVIDPDVFVLRIQDTILRVRKVSLQLSKLTFSEIFNPVMNAVRIHHVRLAPDFINIIMAMFILEGIGRRLDPESDILRVALPMLRTWLREDAKGELSLKHPATAARRWNLYKVWIYVEFREYFDRVRNWAYEDAEFFGEFSPYVTV
ncbi:hypothetical protein GGF40_003339 [Coemansia sp. RSA 1286]|nr:hypothetical protein GGF40_003339 [Coemansia sp. RSA 1286]